MKIKSSIVLPCDKRLDVIKLEDKISGVEPLMDDMDMDNMLESKRKAQRVIEISEEQFQQMITVGSVNFIPDYIIV